MGTQWFCFTIAPVDIEQKYSIQYNYWQLCQSLFI